MSSPQDRPSGWVAWFARNPVAANLLMAALLLLGGMTAMTIRTDGFPEPAPRQIVVTVAFQGASARDVETGAAIKVEQALNGLEGIKKIDTTVTASAAVVSVTSIDGYPLTELKTNVQARVDAITSFPSQVDTITVTAAQADRHVIYAQVSGDVGHRVLKETARQLREQLLALPTISSVVTEGALAYEITVELREDKLRAYGLSFAEVATALRGQSVNLSAGTLETARGTITLQSRNQAYYGAELERTVIRSSAQGGLVRLSDVATVVDGFAEDPLISLYNGQPSIRLDVQLTGNDSITKAADAVMDKVADIRARGTLPAGVSLAFWSDEAQEIRDRLSLMLNNAVMGMVLVFAMLAMFLNMRLAIWVALGIPVSFAGALYVMGPGWFDYSVNDLTTFAFIIVLGIVVDDAIVIGESIFTHKEAGDDGTETAVRGALEVTTPATFGVLTTISAFYPLTLMSSDFGGAFGVIAVVIILCLLFSLVESKFILPAHLAHLSLRRTHPKGTIGRVWATFQSRLNAGLKWVSERVYQPILRAAVHNLVVAFLLSLAVFFAALGLMTRGIVPTVFFPDRDASVVLLNLTLESGTPLVRTRAIAEAYERALFDTGDAFESEYQMAASPIRNSYVSSTSAENVVFTVELVGGTERGFPSNDFLDAWRANSPLPPAVRQLDFFTEEIDIEDIRIELGSDDPVLAEHAMAQLEETLLRIQGVNDIYTNLDTRATELTFELLPIGERLGLTNLSLINQLRDSVFGFEAQTIQRGIEEVSLRVRLPRDQRNGLNDLSRIRITTPDGGSVPLTSVASLTTHEVPQTYARIDGQRVLVLSAKVDRSVTTPDAVLNELETTVFPSLATDFPDVSIRIEGEAEQESAATSDLLSGMIMALLAIYGLLAIPLRSYAMPIVIMSAIPFGIVGAVVGHLIIGIPISLLSFFGILALSGVVVNDALVLASRYNMNRNAGMDYRTAILDAAPRRFRAIMLTSATTFAGLTPLILETAEHAQVLVPMAVSLAFGLLFATAITLIIVPVMLGLLDQLTNWISVTAKPEKSLS